MILTALDRVFRFLSEIDRRVIYLLIALSLVIPLVTGVTLKPAPMATAEAFFAVINERTPDNTPFVLIALDWGPSTKAENGAQSEVALEHLMRKRIPFGVITLSPYAGPFLDSLPQTVAARLKAEDPTFEWKYGVDWVNLGFQPSGALFIQNLSKSEDISETLVTDARGTPLQDLSVMSRVKTLKDIPIFAQFTGLVGVFNTWLQFLQKDSFRPVMLHGCTSITIPEAYIYYVSKQIRGLHEGLAGAAAYEDLLSAQYPGRIVGSALRQNTSLAIAQLAIVALVIVGNLGYFLTKGRK